ncbi:MAG: hypothetical protein KDA93_12740 [Planctomycetaceae bacterium]|nr:hypothetical protein [Planctomycetaceae bacterium]
MGETATKQRPRSKAGRRHKATQAKSDPNPVAPQLEAPFIPRRIPANEIWFAQDVAKVLGMRPDVEPFKTLKEEAGVLKVGKRHFLNTNDVITVLIRRRDLSSGGEA